MAAQLSLPHISLLLRAGVLELRTRAGRNALRDDATEEPRLDGAVLQRARFDALSHQCRVAGCIERPRAGSGRTHPGVELLGRQRPDVEVHVGKAVAAE